MKRRNKGYIIFEILFILIVSLFFVCKIFYTTEESLNETLYIMGTFIVFRIIMTILLNVINKVNFLYVVVNLLRFAGCVLIFAVELVPVFTDIVINISYAENISSDILARLQEFYIALVILCAVLAIFTDFILFIFNFKKLSKKIMPVRFNIMQIVSLLLSLITLGYLTYGLWGIYYNTGFMYNKDYFIMFVLFIIGVFAFIYQMTYCGNKGACIINNLVRNGSLIAMCGYIIYFIVTNYTQNDKIFIMVTAGACAIIVFAALIIEFIQIAKRPKYKAFVENDQFYFYNNDNNYKSSNYEQIEN